MPGLFAKQPARPREVAAPPACNELVDRVIAERFGLALGGSRLRRRLRRRSGALERDDDLLAVRDVRAGRVCACGTVGAISCAADAGTAGDASCS